MDKQTLDLKDIHLPDPVSWWPIAAGWWLLLACLITLLVAVYFAIKRYKNKQINREIHTEISQIKKQFRHSKDKLELAQSLSVLLRRTSISLYSEKDVAGLTGDQWLAFLDKTNLKKSSTSNNFQSETGKALIVAPYLPNSSDFDFNPKALIKLCEGWLENRKVPAT